MCFTCKETGHLTRECPDNPRGLYPKGGGCKECGSVEHLLRDCPERGGQRKKIRLATISTTASADALDDDNPQDTDSRDSGNDDDEEDRSGAQR